ncbi:unnamed protein product [marine sediment metagenome]|uniref:Uncharacterized protein n=1 Tax=marine sediment metagenome TaxID=412755 RepID=X1VYL1_9ZZZZ
MGFGSAIKGLTGGINPAALGRRVIRVGTFEDIKTESAPSGAAAVNLFRVWGGEVMVTGMYGIVTETIGVALCQMGPVHTPTGGAVVDMCTVSASIADDPVNTIYCWDGTVAGAAIGPAGAGAVGVGIGIASFGANFQILVEGIIGLQVEVVADEGAIDWILHYIPLDPNAVVNAI